MDNASYLVIGAILTYAGGLLKEWVGWKREDKTWLRESQKVQEEWKRKCEKEDKTFIREAYQSAIRNLSLLEAARPSDTYDMLPDTKGFEIFQEAQQSLAVLCLRHPVPAFMEVVDRFTKLPYHCVDGTRKYVLSMASAESQLFVSNLLEMADKPRTPPRVQGDHEIIVQIDSEYRRQRLVEGHTELPTEYKFHYSFKNMTVTQRQKLVDMYFPEHGTVPYKVDLSLPRFYQKQIYLKSGHKWEAKLDPAEALPEEILKRWEAAYEESLITAKAEAAENGTTD